MSKPVCDRVDQLADKLAALALAAEDGQFCLDAFKALSAHKIGMKRASKGEDASPAEETTMDALMKNIRAAARPNA